MQSCDIYETIIYDSTIKLSYFYYQNIACHLTLKIRIAMFFIQLICFPQSIVRNLFVMGPIR